MSELFVIIKKIAINNPDLVTWAVVAIILILGLALQYSWIKECISEWKLNKLLNNLGIESLHNVTISDGMDGSVFIEHLILTPKNILLLAVKKYKGLIFAADKIEFWTQVIGNKSYKFSNPLRQLESDVLALNSKIENSIIDTKVLFIKGSDFPKGKPDNVVSISNFKEWSENDTATDVPEALRMDWNQLTEIAVSNDLAKDKAVLIDAENTSGLNVFSLVVVITALLLWVAWRLL